MKKLAKKKGRQRHRKPKADGVRWLMSFPSELAFGFLILYYFSLSLGKETKRWKVKDNEPSVWNLLSREGKIRDVETGSEILPIFILIPTNLKRTRFV